MYALLRVETASMCYFTREGQLVFQGLRLWAESQHVSASVSITLRKFVVELRHRTCMKDIHYEESWERVMDSNITLVLNYSRK